MTPAQTPPGRLLVCATPIGNLRDVTLRVLDALAAADVVACEDTRRTAILLRRHGIEARLVSLHERNEGERTHGLLARIRAGALVALVSDAGTPLLSDPGFQLVRACVHEQLPVEVLPGPSAVLSALVASGLPLERWCFVGFLPRRRGELRALLTGARHTLVAFESPRRLPATLRTLAECDPERPAAVCRELTKLHEEVRRGTAAQLAAHFERDSAVRGEVALVVGAAEGAGASREAPSREEALAALRAVVDAGARARPAAAALGRLAGLGANELYRELASSTRAPRS